MLKQIVVEIMLCSLIQIIILSTLVAASAAGAFSTSSISSVQGIADLKTKISKLTLFTSQLGQIQMYVASTNHLYKITDQLPVNVNVNDENEDYSVMTETKTKSTTMQIEIDLITGPKQQKPQCAFMSTSSAATSCIKYICDDESQPSAFKQTQSQMIDNENRLLLLDAKHDQLIECGTIDYGGCRLRRLNDLTILGCNYSAPVIPFSSASGVVTSSSDDNLLFLMVSMENDPTERLDKSDFPVFSIRNLALASSQQSKLQQHQQQQQQLQLQSQQLQLFQLKYPIEYMNYDQTLFDTDFHMKIIYSFKHEGFVYFLFTITNRILTQACNNIVTSPANNQTGSTIVTRMLRICDTTWTAQQQQQQQKTSRNYRDSNQESIEQTLSGSATNLATLSEIVIDCDDELTGTKYHVLQSAHFHSAPDPDNSTLFLTLNTTTETKSSVSAVCSIRMKQLDSHFSTMLNQCLEGNNSYAELVSPYSNKNTWKVPCRCSMISDYFKKSAPYDIFNNERKLFCHNDYFNYMNGRQPLTLTAIRLDTQVKAITSLVSMATNSQKIVLILSTLDSQIVMATYDQISNEAIKYDQLNLPSVLNSYMPTVNRQTAMSIQLAIVDDNMNRLLYITYDRYLIKVNLQNCQQFQTCETCMSGSLNPFCGWCVYDQKCSGEQTCIKRTLYKQQMMTESFTKESLWLNTNNSCPQISDISPSKYLNPMSVSTKAEPIRLGLNLKLLPHVKYFCDVNTNFNEFSSNSIHYSTTLNRIDAIYLNESHIECDLRPIKVKFQKIIRQLPIEKKLANLTLQIRAASSYVSDSVATTLLSNTKLFAFNCSYFTQCNQCLNKELNGGCMWCGSNSRCVFAQENTLCPNESEYYSSENNDMCTRFTTVKGNIKKRIEIAYSSDSNLSQHSEMIIQNRRTNYQTEFKCVFTKVRALNQSIKYTATSLIWLDNENRFDCIYSPYKDLAQLDSESAFQTVYLSIWWSSSFGSSNLKNYHQVRFKSDHFDLFDDEENLLQENFIEINVVNCRVKATSCGQCMDKQLIDLGCGWCSASSKCSIKKDCSSNWINDLNNTDGNSYCSNPVVNELKPVCGPRQNGGSQLVLTGQNLGLSSFDVRVKMKPILSNQNNFKNNNQDLECSLVNDEYVKATRIVCRTKPISDQDGSILTSDYNVYVETNTKNPASLYTSFNKSNQFVFRYVMPQVFSIEPRRGIKSGGSLLKITGKHLSCGSSLTFTMVGSICSIVNVIASPGNDEKTDPLDYVYCRTPAFNTSYSNSVHINMRMDDYELTLNQFKFEYVNDPKIVRFEPERTIASGGLVMTIVGRDFENIQTTSLILSANMYHPSHGIEQEDNKNSFKSVSFEYLMQ